MEIRKYFGKRFVKAKDGYWVNTMPIRAQCWVWINHHGAIPKGMDIRHKNGNKDNNEIENLEMLSRSDHLKRRWKEGRFDIEQSRKQLMEARKWRKTPEGRKKISEKSLEAWEKRPKITLSCKHCEKSFESFCTKTKCCSETCYRRIRKEAHGKPVKNTRIQFPKTCTKCGNGFMAAMPYALYCSTRCRRRKIK